MINGDKPNGLFNRIAFFFQCIKNHRSKNPSSINLTTVKLSLNNIDTYNKSPSRLLSDAFWNSINYADLESQLQDKINIFDIGCGSGKYGNFLNNLTLNSFGSYTGLDIYKSKKFPSKYNHIIDSAENSSTHIKNSTNFIISQSALEHIKSDLLVLDSITDKLLQVGKPFVQVHLIPASASLWLTLWHGWRQYSKGNLSEICNYLFQKFSISFSLVPIGDKECFWTHLKYITIPKIWNKTILRKSNWHWCNQPNVEKKIIQASNNNILSSENLPSFWALIISSPKITLKYK